MTTNMIVRIAESIAIKNEITDFQLKYSISDNKISAISFEIPSGNIKTLGANLLEKIILANFSDGNKIINFIAKLIPQPDNKIIRYKGLWKLLKITDLDSILDKRTFLLQHGNKVIPVGGGRVDLNNKPIIDELILNSDELYFYIGCKVDDNMICNDFKSLVSSVVDGGGFVFFFLGIYMRIHVS